MSDNRRTVEQRREPQVEVVNVSSDTDDTSPNVVDLLMSYHEKVEKMKTRNRRLELKVEQHEKKVDELKKKNLQAQEQYVRHNSSSRDWEKRGDQKEDALEGLERKIALLEDEKRTKEVYFEKLQVDVLIGMRQKLDEIAQNAKGGQTDGSK